MKTKVASRSGKDRYGVRVVRRLFVIPIFGGQDGIAEIREVRHGGWECVELCYECETGMGNNLGGNLKTRWKALINEGEGIVAGK
jgi:hypothetical protein